MATNITNISSSSIYLTSYLPENIYVGTTEKSIEFMVYVDGDKVFSSVYYPYNQVVCVRDIRSIVEAAMLDQQLSIAELTLEAKQSDGTSSCVDDVHVICSSFKTTQGTEAFLRSHFLTTRKSALVPKDGFVDLYNYTKAYEQGNNFSKIYYTLPYTPGEVFTYDYQSSSVQSEKSQVMFKKLTRAFFENLLWDTIEVRCTVIAAEYHVGSRQFNIFFTDEEPSDEFSFLNAFNVPERLYLFGATTTKTQVSRSEAVCGRKAKFYDESVSVIHEVETAPMPYDEAMWLSQMLTSKRVSRIISEETSVTVLISDITSEVTDSAKELIKLKFYWKYAEGTEWI